MKKIFLTSVLLLGLSFATVNAQKHPARPAEKELVSAKRQEIDKRYAFDKKMISKHPVLTDKMKKAQLKTLKDKYNAEIRLLNKAK